MNTDEKRGQGVYFLANDKVFELVVAFLNSFRLYNSTMPLCLIPFDNNYKKVKDLRETYHFEIFRNKRILKLCDKISIDFHGKTNGAYRKLAMWEGIFDEFIYIDVDTVVIDNIDFAFDCLDECDILTSHSNMPHLVKWVWKDSIYESGVLNNKQIAYSSNTGFIVSRKVFMNFDWILKSRKNALELKEHMELYCQEQPFLNYLIVTSNKIYSSLFLLFESGINRKVMFEAWAGLEGGTVRDGKIFFPDGKPIFLVHWAGLWQLYRDSLPGSIPYKELWQYYRDLNSPKIKVMNKARLTCGWWLARLVASLKAVGTHTKSAWRAFKKIWSKANEFTTSQRHYSRLQRRAIFGPIH